MIEQVVAQWHKALDELDVAILDDLLADDAVFHSPVVHTPQEGKDITKMYLMGAAMVFKDAEFEYLREVLSGNNGVLEFKAVLDGIIINGVDMIQCNDEGKIIDFKVMVRPLKAVNMLHQKMAAMLEKMK